MRGIELLGVRREVKNARVAWDTGISANTGDSNTHAYLYLASNHGDTGDNTNYEFGVIRLGYDGEHATKTKISGVDVISVSVVNSKLVLTPVGSTPTFMTLIQ